MTILQDSFVDLDTQRGLMRVHLFTPNLEGTFPAVIFYSEIFQVTGPIRRTAAAMSGQGYIVAVPEVYHEFEPAGTVLAYDHAGADRGNEMKYMKEIRSFDEDAAVTLAFLSSNPKCNGQIGSFGVCLGGHLAVRAGFHPNINAVAAFYPTDIHSHSLGAGKCDDTLEHLATSRTAHLFVWGRQDPHVPLEGRQRIYQRMTDGEVDFEWHEFNAAHAFLRDEGPRYNPALARDAMNLLLRFLQEKLG